MKNTNAQLKEFYKLACDENTPGAKLEKIFNSTVSPRIRKAILANPSVPLSVASSHKASRYVSSAVDNGGIELTLLFSKDKSGATTRLQSTIELLKSLSGDTLGRDEDFFLVDGVAPSASKKEFISSAVTSVCNSTKLSLSSKLGFLYSIFSAHPVTKILLKEKAAATSVRNQIQASPQEFLDYIPTLVENCKVTYSKVNRKVHSSARNYSANSERLLYPDHSRTTPAYFAAYPEPVIEDGTKVRNFTETPGNHINYSAFIRARATLYCMKKSNLISDSLFDSALDRLEAEKANCTFRKIREVGTWNKFSQINPPVGIVLSEVPMNWEHGRSTPELKVFVASLVDYYNSYELSGLNQDPRFGFLESMIVNYATRPSSLFDNLKILFEVTNLKLVSQGADPTRVMLILLNELYHIFSNKFVRRYHATDYHSYNNIASQFVDVKLLQQLVSTTSGRTQLRNFGLGNKKAVSTNTLKHLVIQLNTRSIV